MRIREEALIQFVTASEDRLSWYVISMTMREGLRTVVVVLPTKLQHLVGSLHAQAISRLYVIIKNVGGDGLIQLCT